MLLNRYLTVSSLLVLLAKRYSVLAHFKKNTYFPCKFSLAVYKINRISHGCSGNMKFVSRVEHDITLEINLIFPRNHVIFFIFTIGRNCTKQ